MSLETATYVASLISSNPDGTDQRSTADDHLRLIKACLKRTFPMLDGAVSASAAAVCFINDLSASAQAQLNTLRNGPATANFAVQAASASYANEAGHAQSASYAVHAGTAASASYAISAGYAQSASYATNAGHALSASFATQAQNSLSLGGVAAAGYAQLAVNQSWTAGQAITQTSSSGVGPLTPNCAVSCMFRHVMPAAAALTIAAPTNAKSGQVISIHLVNSGDSTATWNSIYKFAGGVKPTLSTAPSSCDVFSFQFDSISGQWRQAGIGVA